MFRSFFDRLRTSPAAIFAFALFAAFIAYLLPFTADYRTGGLLVFGGIYLGVLALGLVGVKIARVARAYVDERNRPEGIPSQPLSSADATALHGLYVFAGLCAIAVALYLGGAPG